MNNNCLHFALCLAIMKTLVAWLVGCFGFNGPFETEFQSILGRLPEWEKEKTKDRREKPGRVAQSVGHLTRKSGVLGSIPGLATYFLFSFRFFKKGSCQLLAKVCARSIS